MQPTAAPIKVPDADRAQYLQVVAAACSIEYRQVLKPAPVVSR